MAPATPSPIVITPHSEPVTFAGPPEELVGRVDVHNTGELKARLRGVLLNSKGHSNLPSAAKVSSVLLRPGQRKTVLLSVGLDPLTPPGRYELDLDLDGRSRSAVLDIGDAFGMALTPSRLFVENEPDKEQRHRVFLANEGNVGFRIGDLGTVALHPDPPSEQPAGVAKVRLSGGPIVVEPGRLEMAELSIVVTQAPASSVRYRGQIPLLSRDLELVVLPTGSRVERGAPPTTRPPRKKVSGRKTTARKKKAKTAVKAKRKASGRKPTGRGGTSK